MLNRASARAEAALQAARESGRTSTSVISIPCDLTDFNSVRVAANQLKDTYGDSGI